MGVVLDDAVALYRLGWKPLVSISAMVAGPAALLLSVAQVFYLRGYLELLPLFTGGPLPESETAPLLLTSLVSQAASPLYWLASLYVAACAYHAAPALYAGEVPGVRETLRGGLRRFPVLLAVAFLVLLGVQFASLLLVIPGLVLSVRWSLAPAVAVLEGQGVGDTLRRSWRLTRIHWGRIVLFWICLGIVSFAVQGALNSPAVIRQIVDSVRDPQAVFRELSWGWKVFEGLLSASAVSIALPFTTLAWYVFYVDMRARTEGMDLLVRARELAPPAATELA